MDFSKIEVIYYQRDNQKGVLSTKCPYGTKFMCGSVACMSCKFSMGLNLREHCIYCTYKKDKING